MADVAFGYVVTQDETIVPTVFDLGTVGEVVDLTGAVTVAFTRDLGSSVFLVGVNGGAVDATMLERARVFVEAASGLFIGGSAGGFRASDNTASAAPADEGSFVPGTWTAT